MYWDNEYISNRLVWGEDPSELGRIAVDYLKVKGLHNDELNVLDIGCGYGRDIVYYLAYLQCTILGIDNSEKAIATAASMIPDFQKTRVKFRCCDYRDIKNDQFDIVLASNFYQLLKDSEREEFRKMVDNTLKTNVLLFLSTLSVNDPEHRGKDRILSDGSCSYHDKVFLHLCSGDELSEDFRVLRIEELYEHEFYEPRANGETHHHISWILIGQRN
jgi:cyclopropane fatty-acyl-phospholipid synthase-like methyltransferase